MRYEEYVLRLRRLADRLGACMLARSLSDWRKRQELTRIVELGAGAIHAIEQSSYWGADPIGVKLSTDEEYKPYFESVVKELVSVGGAMVSRPSLWRAGYYFNDAAVRIQAMAEQISRRLYRNNEDRLTDKEPLLQRIKTRRDYFAHQASRTWREAELQDLLVGLELLVGECEKLIDEKMPPRA